jgi:amino acid adenylation domain-containing protein
MIASELNDQGSSWSTGDIAALDDGGPVDIEFEPFEAAAVERPIWARFAAIAVENAERLAIDDGARRFHYGELKGAVHRLASRIDMVVPAGKPVGVLLANGAFFPVAALACLALGRPYVPVDLKYPAARNQDVMREAGLAAVILDPSDTAASELAGSLPRIDIVAAIAGSAEPTLLAAPADGPAVILYTSGSTGRPKGICNDQRALLQRVAQFVNACHLHKRDRFILLSSPGTIAGVRDTLAALLVGASLHIADPHELGIRGVLARLHDAGITICYAVPALLRMLLRPPDARAAFAQVRVLRLGGDVMLTSDLTLCRAVLPQHCEILLGFGSTETPTVCQWFVPPSWPDDALRVPLGRALPGIEFIIADERGGTVPRGEVGELIVRSRYLALGAWQEGRLQPGPFHRDPRDPSLRSIRTGDLVRLRADGLWELIGRADRQIKIRGLRIDLGDIEAALRSCSGVEDAAVIARRAGGEVTGLAGFVVPRGAAEIENELRRSLAARLPKHMHPSEIRFIEAIPQLPGFKPDIPALERYDQRVREASAATPREPLGPASRPQGTALVRDAVARAWSAVLDAESFAVDRPWNEAGGDSLKAMQLWFHLEEVLGRRLPLDALDDQATPSELIAAIERDIEHRSSGRVDRDALNASRTVFLIPGVGGDEPLLVRFRAAFRDQLRFKVVDLPGWREMIDAKASLVAIVDAVVDQILAEPGDEPYQLAGYSFGGFIAYEAARRLVRTGHRVSFLGLLDARRSDLERNGNMRRYQRLAAEPARLPISLLRLTFAVLLRLRCFKILRALTAWIMPRPSAAAYVFHRHLIEKMRVYALRRWQPVPIDVRTTLFLSGEHLRGASSDYDWGAICKPLEILHIGGSHISMLERRELLRERFLAAVQAAEDA